MKALQFTMCSESSTKTMVHVLISTPLHIALMTLQLLGNRPVDSNPSKQHEQNITKSKA